MSFFPLHRSTTMATSFDRRRANGPDKTFQPLYDVEINANTSKNERVWNINEHFVLRDPSSVQGDNLALHTLRIGEDSMAVTCMAQKSIARCKENRSVKDARPICTCAQLIQIFKQA